MADYLSIVKQELEEATKVLTAFLEDEKNLSLIDEAASVLVKSFQEGGKVISCGNGGSHCDAMHFAEELTGRYRNDREPFPALAISDPSHITCVSNDFGFDRIFSRYIRGLGQKGDVLLAISTSGNSVNVVRAAEVAKQKNIKVIGLTGNNGGELAEFCDVHINVPFKGYADRIQEIHIKIIHILINLIERKSM